MRVSKPDHIKKIIRHRIEHAIRLVSVIGVASKLQNAMDTNRLLLSTNALRVRLMVYVNYVVNFLENIMDYA